MPLFFLGMFGERALVRVLAREAGWTPWYKVVYVPDQGAKSAFVVTAYELRGKALRAYRRAKRRKKR